MHRLRNTSTLTAVALLLALGVILGMFKLPITSFIEIRFQHLPFAVGGMFFGPVIGGLLGGLTDIVAFIIKPTGAFFPGFTLASIMSGVIYGLFLYNKPVTVKRVALCVLVEAIVCDAIIKTICLSMLYGTPFFVTLGARAIKLIVMYPINTAILYFVLRAAQERLSSLFAARA